MGIGSLLAAARNARFRQCGDGLPSDDGRRRGPRITATFDGDASLRKRPMRRILDPLALMGAQVLSEAEGGRCPIVLKGTANPRRSNIAPPSPRRRSNPPSCSPASTRPADDRDRGASLARPYGEDARPFRRGGRDRTLGRGPADHARRPAGTAAGDRGRSGRSLVGRVSAGRGADHAGLGHRHRRR